MSGVGAGPDTVFMLPVDVQEQLQVALARWQGRGPTADDDYVAGKELADAAFAVLVWNSNQTD